MTMIMPSMHTKCAIIIQALILIALSTFYRSGIAAPVPDIVHLRATDPHFGEALLYFYQGNYRSSMVRLAAFEKMQQLPTQKEDSDLLLGILERSYGMDNGAQGSFAKILSNKKYSQRARDIAALYLAKIHYKQGALAEASNTLSSIGDTLPSRLKKEKDLLLANVLIDNNQFPAAEKILPRPNGEGEVDTLIWYGQHNLGVAMLKNGPSHQGISILRKISAESFDDNERRALQDKVNLVLGYAYIQAGDMNAAIGYFEKIKINGPFSLQALLGLGFAEAALGQHQRALIPWLELQKRDIRESEVQEASLMIPETLFKLESYKKAQTNYQNAVSLYKSEIDDLSAAIEATRAGKITTSILAKGMLEENRWNDFIMQPSALPEARYFPWYLRNEEFRQAVSLYREALALRNMVVSQKESLNDYGLSQVVTARYAEKISGNIAEIDDTITKVEGYIQNFAINWLQNRKASLNGYLSQASLGSAKVYHHAAERGDQ